MLEAVYRFPLPGDAAVTGVRVRFGDVEISAELKARQQAEADYEEAKRQGQQAALATRESPDVFTLQVAGLQPDQDIVVETSYTQLARAEGAGWSLRAPLTTSPRYVRSDEIASHPAHGQPLLVMRDPGHRFSLDLLIGGAGAITSATHALAISAEGSSARVQLAGGEVLPDRDCVLSWQPAQTAGRPAMDVFLHRDATSGQTYFLAQVTPPGGPLPVPRVPREAIVFSNSKYGVGPSMRNQFKLSEHEIE
jgi:Ca-activated chloride channel family protein